MKEDGIDNITAPAQVGTHKGSNRQTYGHSIAVAPWSFVMSLRKMDSMERISKIITCYSKH